MSQKQRTGDIKDTNCSVFTDQEQHFVLVLHLTQYLPSNHFHMRMRRGTISEMMYSLINTSWRTHFRYLKTIGEF